MLTANKGFIPEDLFKAPEYELAKNHNKELPDVEKIATRARYLDSLAPISAIQVFEEIPGIKKSTISLNTETFFEVWNVISGRVLLPEDLEFLKQDANRVESIAKNLLWLGESWLSSQIFEKKLKVENWEDVQKVVNRYEYEYEFIDIVEVPYKVSLEPHKNKFGEVNEYWGVYPTCWNISLNRTRGFNGCYIINDYNSSYRFNIEVWAGIPFFRNVKTGEVVTLENL
ncbi:hypothetical protein H6F74_00375 [Trichocoleus sp. FACHB-90]|uniref:hypothetical protein n=1 Tax=Cyanophyceae TaxID=3028117 RepID=UPI0016828D79|nr:hypothetical protein [Trichocoleus sp. FACHB-90]MBD1924746.1 hypothetical protein [Trichocoleus sp. FACHB-90]